MIFESEDEHDAYVAHYGIARRSGRYPWGSGGNPYQRGKDLLGMIKELEDKGFSPVEIARSFSTPEVKFTTTDLRNAKSIAKAAIDAEDRALAVKLKDKGLSNVAIGERMGKNESSVRALLKDAESSKQAILTNTADALKNNMAESGGYLDIGKGTGNHLGVSPEKLAMSVAMLKDEGYEVFYVPVEQQGTGKNTTTKVLAPPGTKFPDVVNNQERIKSIATYSEDGGRSFMAIQPPVSVDPKRVSVRYAEDGGDQKDGVIELRRGVEDLSLGSSRYAQVRVKVGDNHYLKGMAMYSDDMPDGVDIIFNTNKNNTGDKLKAMKSIKVDEQTGQQADLPFGSIVRQKNYVDSKGRERLSPLNIVGSVKKDDDGNDISYSGEEGGWGKWSKSLSSQFLSKQSTDLARQQLKIAGDRKEDELREIEALTNPTIKKKLLAAYADGADSAANYMKAAGLPRTANHVLLPINSLKDTEIYAPNYKNGEKVILVRHPHGGTFEIPELTVNNRNREANRLIKQAKDAVGINANVAGRLSGADFDGDTVLVIPNPSTGKSRVKTTPPLAGLKGFDPQRAHPAYDGMKTIDGGVWDAKLGKPVYPTDPKTGKPRSPNKQNKQTEMGKISNLITDMTIQGAPPSEIVRAVRHSMVVIDAEKHSLDYKTSFKQNGIAELKETYQSTPAGGKGAATLISRAKSPVRPLERRPRRAEDGGPIDPVTGEKMWEYTGGSYINRQGKEVVKLAPKSTRMNETRDARDLVSRDGGTVMEYVYADHANRLKSLANRARKASLETPPLKRNPSAAKAYASEVASLSAKLDLAQRNAPLERQAQILAATMVKAKVNSNPDLDNDGVKKIKAAAINEARARVGAKKPAIKITDKEWSAIQAGAITNNKLASILDNADLDQVKQLATPRVGSQLPAGKIARAKSLLARGYDYSEIGEMLGVPTSTLHDAVNG